MHNRDGRIQSNRQASTDAAGSFFWSSEIAAPSAFNLLEAE